MNDNAYDITIVGAGIAGLAIAEIYTRSGYKVLLVEKNNKICLEASGSHHEWFHFGSLYSIFPSNSFMRTLVGGLDDILMYYRDFEGMNLKVTENGKLITTNNKNRWIREDYLEYIINARNDEDFNLSKSVGIKDFFKRFFFKFGWDKNIKQFISRHNRFQKYDWRKGCASYHIPRMGILDYSRKMISKFQNDDINLNPDTHFKVQGFDKPMTAFNIIQDLTRSFISNGGDILVNHEYIGQATQEDFTILQFYNNARIKTKKVIFASGAGLEKIVKKDISIKTVLSPLMTVYPRVCDINFVRLTPFMHKTINHLTHVIDGKEYSLIGGGYFANPNDKEEMDVIKENLIKRAEIVFPKLKNATIKEIYFSPKTEIITSLLKRNYQYVIEKIDKNQYIVVPGKFSLAFSLAVNTFKKIEGHEPNTYVAYNKNIDVSKYIGIMKHKRILMEKSK